MFSVVISHLVPFVVSSDTSTCNNTAKCCFETRCSSRSVIQVSVLAFRDLCFQLLFHPVSPALFRPKFNHQCLHIQCAAKSSAAYIRLVLKFQHWPILRQKHGKTTPKVANVESAFNIRSTFKMPGFNINSFWNPMLFQH